MKFKSYLGAAAALSMVAAPALAAPVNPAASLSLGNSTRASGHGKHNDDLLGGGLLIALIAAAAVIAGVVVIATDNSSSP